MNKRLFIAINLPRNIKEKISDAVDNLQENKLIKNIKDIRFIPSENWHLTLSFLGYQPEEKIGCIANAINNVLALSNMATIEIKFNAMAFGPTDAISKRIIWLTTFQETNNLLSKIKNDLDDELNKNSVKFQNDYKKFNGHLTLARFNPIRIQNDLITHLPISFQAKSIDLMESHLNRAGAKYKIIKSINF